MRVLLPTLSIFVLLTPDAARATFHLWDITEVYSNADGSVQFIELFTSANSQDELAGHLLESDLETYAFPTDLDPDELGNGNNATANQHMLIATPAFASQPGAVTPDFVLDGPTFFDFVDDLLDFAGVDSFGWTSGELPTNGVDSLNEPLGSNVRSVGVNSPTNFAGEVGELPEPFGIGALLAGGAVAVVLACRRESVQKDRAARSG
jgi:serralysin